MIFYRINAATPFLVATQVDARREARAAKVEWEQVDVPTDKAGLMAYVNALLTPTPFEHPEFGPPNDDPPEERRKQAAAGLTASQPAFVQASEGRFRVSREAVLQSISAANSGDLGYYAMEVAARFDAITERVREAA